MDLSSLEICQREIRTLPNTNTVADLQTCRTLWLAWPKNSWVTAHDWCSAGNYRGWPQRPCLALGPYPSPIQFPSRLGMPKQLFWMLPTVLPWPNPPASSSLSFPYCFWCHQPFSSSWSLFLLHCSYEHDPQLIFFLPLPSLLQRFIFFCPNPFFSATPTQFFSWLPPPLAYSTFQSLMTFSNHLYELRAFLPESWITWSSSSSNHMAMWTASTKEMKSKKHVQAGPLLRSIGHIFAERTAYKSFFMGILKSGISFSFLLRHCSF